MGNIRDWIEIAAKFIEALAVVIIIVGIIYGIGRYFFHQKQQVANAYKHFKNQIGKALLLGLEFLVAADIIRTVALSPNPAKHCSVGSVSAHSYVPELVFSGGDRGPVAVEEKG